MSKRTKTGESHSTKTRIFQVSNLNRSTAGKARLLGFYFINFRLQVTTFKCASGAITSIRNRAFSQSALEAERISCNKTGSSAFWVTNSACAGLMRCTALVKQGCPIVVVIAAFLLGLSVVMGGDAAELSSEG
eukprot:gene826-897_t